MALLQIYQAFHGEICIHIYDQAWGYSEPLTYAREIYSFLDGNTLLHFKIAKFLLADCIFACKYVVLDKYIYLKMPYNNT